MRGDSEDTGGYNFLSIDIVVSEDTFSCVGWKNGDFNPALRRFGKHQRLQGEKRGWLEFRVGRRRRGGE